MCLLHCSSYHTCDADFAFLPCACSTHDAKRCRFRLLVQTTATDTFWSACTLSWFPAFWLFSSSLLFVSSPLTAHSSISLFLQALRFRFGTTRLARRAHCRWCRLRSSTRPCPAGTSSCSSPRCALFHRLFARFALWARVVLRM